MTGDLDTLITRWGHAYLLGYARDRWIAIRRDGMLFIPADTLTQLEAEIGYDAGKNPAALDEDPASAAVGYLPARERDGTASTSDELPLVVQAAEAITAHLAQQYTILADLRDLLPGWHINADPDRYPPPGEAGWSEQAIGHLLANPKYTGYMVLGRTRKIGGKTRHLPPDQWLWSPQPAHVALVDKATWDAAQRIGAERGNTRDAEMPTTQPGRRYLLRSRIRCRICQRRMCGITRPAPSYYKDTPGAIYTYYRCPHTQANPRHVAAHPDHPAVSVREDAIMTAITTFLAERVFGPDRAAMLAAQLPSFRPAPLRRPPAARPKAPPSASSSRRSTPLRRR